MCDTLGFNSCRTRQDKNLQWTQNVQWSPIFITISCKSLSRWSPHSQTASLLPSWVFFNSFRCGILIGKHLNPKYILMKNNSTISKTWRVRKLLLPTSDTRNVSSRMSWNLSLLIVSESIQIPMGNMSVCVY